MTDKRISELGDGNPAQPTDLIPVGRGSLTRYVTAASLSGLGGGGFGPSVDDEATISMPLPTGDPTTVLQGAVLSNGMTMEYKTGLGDFKRNANVGLVKDGIFNLVARTSADITSQRCRAELYAIRPSGLSNGSTHTLCVGVSDEPLSTWNQAGYLFIRMAGTTSQLITYGYVDELDNSFNIAGAFAPSLPSAGDTLGMRIDIDGGRVVVSTSSDNGATFTPLFVNNVPFQFVGSDGVMFHRGRRGGFYTDIINVNTQYAITFVRFQTFAV